MRLTAGIAVPGGQPLDLYQSDEPPRGVAIYAHGGGFSRGSRAEPLARALAEILVPKGWAVASAGYRLGVRLAAFPPEEAPGIRAMVARGDRVGLGMARRLRGAAMVAAADDLSATLHALRARFPGLPVALIGVSAGGIAGFMLTHPPALRAGRLARPDGLVAVGAACAHPWSIARPGPPVMLVTALRDRIIPARDTALTAARLAATGQPPQWLRDVVRGHRNLGAALATGPAGDALPGFLSRLRPGGGCG